MALLLFISVCLPVKVFVELSILLATVFTVPAAKMAVFIRGLRPETNGFILR